MNNYCDKLKIFHKKNRQYLRSSKDSRDIILRIEMLKKLAHNPPGRNRRHPDLWPQITAIAGSNHAVTELWQ